MFRLSEKVKKLEDKINALISKHKSKFPAYIGLGLLILYFYGMLLRFVGIGAFNFRSGEEEAWFTWNPFKNIFAIFTPYGIMITLFVVIMYCLFAKKGYQLLSGYKTVRDKERGIELLPEGTHGTSGWMNKKELEEVLVKNSYEIIDKLRPYIRDISYSTYFRRRHHAIDTLSSILWGYTSKESLAVLEHFLPNLVHGT